LRAAVATLPAGAADLAAALSLLADGAGRGLLVALVGGAGGVGTSTLAAALALAGAREGRRTLLLDADPGGGGIDVLIGAEHVPGWRWSRFDAARGHLGNIATQLPHCDGVDVLAVDRDARPGLVLQPEQLAAVLGSAARSSELTVVDLPRHLDPAHDEVLRRADRVLLLARADVRGVAAADRASRALVPRCRVLEVVVRTGPGRTLEPGLVADALDLPLAGTLVEDPTVRAAAERGEPPGRSPRSALARLCGQLLREPAGVAA
jgi:secretion/DNA translocation related CpaE-like protein